MEYEQMKVKNTLKEYSADSSLAVTTTILQGRTASEEDPVWNNQRKSTYGIIIHRTDSPFRPIYEIKLMLFLEKSSYLNDPSGSPGV